MKKNRRETEEKIRKFFENISPEISPRKIRQIKRLAMHYNIKLGKLKKKFCKKCFSLFTSKSSQTRIRKGKIIIKCLKCGNVQRYKIKTS